jgi:hypothetical protein
MKGLRALAPCLREAARVARPLELDGGVCAWVVDVIVGLALWGVPAVGRKTLAGHEEPVGAQDAP